ncbi:MAG: hypothetical protein HRS57_01915 [Mycoplasmataceae bacterium]|nr:hypothetical protein [Mycoplasmataceae bacterium]
MVVNSVTVAFSVLYVDELNNAVDESVLDESGSGIETIDVDTIGSDPFI